LTESENKKLPIVYIGLEPDMFFEITDQLRIRLLAMNMNITNRLLNGDGTDSKEQRKYLYLKSIVALLETQLTS
jgi:hypothetical protein